MSKSFLLNRRRFLKTAGLTLFAGTAACGYAWRIEPYWVEFVCRELPVAGLPEGLVGSTLVQFSDLHVGPKVDDDYLIEVLDQVSQRRPDIVAITGDFMTCEGVEEVARTLRVLEHLRPARLATVAVLGNHDYSMNYQRREVGDQLAAGLTDLGIEVLRNTRRDVAGLAITGLDDAWGPRFRPYDILPHLDTAAANLVLCHNPDAADLPIWYGYRGWILCGHTHGGQCKLPFLPPPRLPVANRRYVAGEYDLFDGRRMYINRGLGHARQVRFNVRPEVTVFTLRRAPAVV
jgi:predicted MPP superfamily phosphohydrolase